jgi:hypothetical protein
MTRVGAPNQQILVFCNKLQTVCERSATVLTSREARQQFVNEVQQIVIAASRKDDSETTKNRVVEHKGLGCPRRVFGDFCLLRLRFLRDASWENASLEGCTLNFSISNVPKGLWHPLHVRGAHMAQRAIRFSETTYKGIREATEKRGFSSPTAFLRYAVEQELAGHKEQLMSAEGRLAARIEQAREIATALNHRSYRTRRGTPWRLESVARVLNSTPSLALNR